MGEIMDRRDEILTILAEECAEVIQEVMKVKRFGDQEYNGESAMQRLVKELGDIECMINLMQEFDMINFEELETQAVSKRLKLEKWSNIFES